MANVSSVILLTRNTLDLTKKCVESINAQDIPTRTIIYDNGSTDGTPKWIAEKNTPGKFEGLLFCENLGVSNGWNRGLNFVFNGLRENYCLVVNSDTILSSWFLSSLLSYDLPFISGVSVDVMSAIQYPSRWENPAPCPDFSGFLIRRDCWETVGPFDEAMVHYASDCDYHVRAHRAGITLLNSGVPFYHERSSTLKNADPQDRATISNQANADRQAFRDKWNCIPGEPAYADLFKPELFGKGL
jgi:GT2 family glycosyltransferase